MDDSFLRTAVLGAVLLGINCGILGSFLVVRRMAMVGDTLSHAVLPGVVAGYLWNYTKDPMAMLIGALGAGIIGSLLMSAITSTTKLKQDAAQGIILTTFFAVGVCLITMLPPGNKAGLEKFLFGQLAAVSSQDVVWLVRTTGLTLLVVVLLFRGLLLLSFDPVFGRLLGLPMRFLHYGLMLLTTLTIVVAMEAVGVVLVSALLVIPASSASLLTDRFSRLILLSAIFGVIAALSGSFFSFVFDDLAAGPMVVISSAVIFALAFCFSSKNGLLIRWLRNRRRDTVVAMENQLKAIYRFHEDRGSDVSGPFDAAEISALKGPWILRRLLANEMIVEGASAGLFALTEKGKNTAQRLVRHHRLWELYLANRAKYALDHVHDDAEKMEHLMTDEQAGRLAEVLGNPTTDPHGRLIP